jgi:hypothetical protein
MGLVEASDKWGNSMVTFVTGRKPQTPRFNVKKPGQLASALAHVDSLHRVNVVCLNGAVCFGTGSDFAARANTDLDGVGGSIREVAMDALDRNTLADVRNLTSLVLKFL